jgi:hypothetical protein
MGDKFIEHWPTLVSLVITGGGMTYLASISDWLKPYGPVGWGAVGMLSILLIVVVYFIYGISKQRLALADYTKRSSEGVTTRVLAPMHENETIKLADFYHPYFEPRE